jgi:hypothetical protein
VRGQERIRKRRKGRGEACRMCREPGIKVARNCHCIPASTLIALPIKVAIRSFSLKILVRRVKDVAMIPTALSISSSTARTLPPKGGIGWGFCSEVFVGLRGGNSGEALDVFFVSLVITGNRRRLCRRWQKHICTVNFMRLHSRRAP